MLENLIIDKNKETPIYYQIADAIMMQIEKGTLKDGVALPSINVFNERFSVARETVEKAYTELKKRGYVSSVKGRGYFIKSANFNKVKILLIFNKISSFKKIVYYSFINALKDAAKVDLEIHHYNPQILNDIIDKNIGKYHYYVIMPHFDGNAKPKLYTKIIQRIPKDELLLLDKRLPTIPCDKAVYQDFQNDILNILRESGGDLKKYASLTLLFPEEANHPKEITEGIQTYCAETNKSFKVLMDAKVIPLRKGSLFIVISDDDLVALIQQIRMSPFKIGKDIGIISFNETPLKSLLDVTVVSTDFDLMGKTAAELILKGKNASVKNPFYIIKRGSI